MLAFGRASKCNSIQFTGKSTEKSTKESKSIHEHVRKYNQNLLNYADPLKGFRNKNIVQCKEKRKKKLNIQKFKYQKY